MALFRACETPIPSVYVNEIHAFKKQLESEYRVDPTYLDPTNPDRTIRSKHRALTVSWLFKLSHSFHLRPDSFFLSIQLLDMFLQHKIIKLEQLQLYACACMYLACKQEEIYFPEQRDFVYVGDGAFTLQQFQASEHVAIDVLNFNLGVPTCLTFFGIFFQRFYCSDPIKKGPLCAAEDVEEVHKLGMLLLYCSAQESTLLAFKPSARAAVALLVAMLCQHWFKQWNPQHASLSQPIKLAPLPDITTFTGYTMPELQACLSDTYALLGTERCIHKIDTNNLSDSELIMCSVNEHYDEHELKTIERLRLFVKNIDKIQNIYDTT